MRHSVTSSLDIIATMTTLMNTRLSILDDWLNIERRYAALRCAMRRRVALFLVLRKTLPSAEHCRISAVMFTPMLMSKTVRGTSLWAKR